MTVSKTTSWRESWTFAIILWLLSRLTIGLAMLAIAPILPAPPGETAPTFGWGVFAAWDSDLYRNIVTNGYAYDSSRNEYSVAFFPLFPLLIKTVMALGLPFEIAGFLVNNLAFLGAVLLIYHWVRELYGIGAARWTTAVLVWCPFSLFSTVIYTEGLFLLLSAAALRAFQKKQHFWAAIWGALATATRLPGLALVPTFLIVSWREKRSLMAYIASFTTAGGLFLYSLYCGLKFGDPLVFLKAQKAWQPAQDFWGQDWLKMFMQVIVGSRNWRAGSLVDPWPLLIFVLICIGSYGLWRSRSKLGKNKTQIGFCLLALILWLVVGSPLINTVTVLGGLYLLWHFRAELNLLAIYGFCSFGIIFSSGRATSAERYTYAIVSVSIALGLLLARYPRWGYPVMIFFGFLLASLAVRFAQHLWAG
jgi:Gpi18-like mannosyltransferase